MWAQYELRLTQLDILFHFVLHAFENLSLAKRRDFVRALKFDEQSKVVEAAERLRKLSASGAEFKDVLDDTLIKDFQDRRLKKVKQNFRSKTHTQYAEWVTDGMASAEILFRFTIFEDFLKHVHAAILVADPKVLAVTSGKRTATLGEVFAGSFDQFKEHQICREVEELDRQGMEKRLDYFLRFLGVDLTKFGKLLTEISDVRNKIAHGNPLEAITKEDTSLPLEGIQNHIAKVVRDAMRFTFERGRSAYPQKFVNK